MKRTPRISRVRRCASQRSTQAKMVCISTRLKSAKVNRTSSAQGNNKGRARLMPRRIPSKPTVPSALAGSKKPYAKRIRKYDRYVRGKRSSSAESGLLVNAVDITGKSCQKKKTGHSRIARYAALFCETKYQANPVARAKAPIPPTVKAIVIKIREASSILPRLLRRPLRNMRQRNSAMVRT
jgi:hypothetical protein